MKAKICMKKIRGLHPDRVVFEPGEKVIFTVQGVGDLPVELTKTTAPPNGSYWYFEGFVVSKRKCNKRWIQARYSRFYGKGYLTLLRRGEMPSHSTEAVLV